MSIDDRSDITRQSPDIKDAGQSIWELGTRTLDTSKRPLIMGILNVTPDSFSDGSLYLDVDRAVDRALEMESEGADSIDIGGESTRPFASPVDEEEEMRRVIPVIERLAGCLRIPVSIDTYKSSVAMAALRAGAEIVNDISGCTFDPHMPQVVASTRCGLVIMHTRGRPSEMQQDTTYQALIPDIIHFLRRRIFHVETYGVRQQQVVVDPGIGFGKNLKGNLEIIRRLSEFEVLGRPIMIGPSRKSFIGEILDRNVGERVFGTAATVALAIANGASLVRIHDVRQMRDVALVAHAVTRQQA